MTVLSGSEVMRSAAVRVSLLGPARVHRSDTEANVGSAQRKAVLAVLALRAGDVVSKSELVDAVWGDEPPASAHGSIYTHISALRSVLEPYRSPRTEGTLLTSEGSGYCLTLPMGSVDVDNFQQLRGDARACRNNRDTAGELAALDGALALWHGNALDAVPGPFAARHRARLTGLKLDVIERRARVLLNAGRPYLLVDDLHELARKHPLREGLHGLLMQALYLTGRREAAIGVFHLLRDVTIESLGTEPGGALATLYDKILRDDPALRWTVDGVPGMTRPIPLATNVLRRTARCFAGRVSEVAMLRAAVMPISRGTGGFLWIEGEQGIGKTTLLNEALGDVHGCQLAWATGDELGQMVPLRALVNGLAITSSSPDPRRAALAAVVQQLEPLPVGRDREGAEAAVESMVAFIGQLCADGPLILVVDQLHWLDAVSWHVLRRLAVETAVLPLLLIVASRPVRMQPELERARALLRQHALLIMLGPLTDDSVEELATVVAGAAPGPGLRQLLRETSGNPWLVEVLVDHLIDSGALVIEGRRAEVEQCDPLRNNSEMVDVIHSQMLATPKRVRDLLGWASLCGDRFTVEEIAAAMMMPEAEVSAVFAEAVTGGYLVASGHYFSMRHKMIRGAFYNRCTPAIRGSLHRQLAEAWAAIGRPAERVAEQLALSPLGNDSWLRDWLTTNAAALSERAPRLASALLHRVLSADAMSPAHKYAVTALLARPAIRQEDDSGFSCALLTEY